MPAGQRNIVVIGASAGGVEALTKLTHDLPHEFPAAVFVVLHIMASGTSLLPTILDRSSPLPVSTARDGERHERGHIYVAPPDRHLVVLGERMRLTRGPRENGHRPAVDPMFRSAARAHGPRVVGVVLSGALDDGTAGLRLVKERGGATVVQDPEDALYPSMPRSALDFAEPDHVVALHAMARLLCRVLDEPPNPAPPHAPDDPRPAGAGDELALRPEYIATDQAPTGLTCPECGGALWEHGEEGAVRFACRVGHGFAPDSLVDEQARALEAALWGALRSLEERIDLLRRIARRGAAGAGRRFEERARTAERHAADLRKAIDRLGAATLTDADDLEEGRSRADEEPSR